MKKLPWQILTVILLSEACWLGSMAVAADAKPERRPPAAGAPGEGGVRERMERIATELKLSDNQKAEVRSILQEQGETLRELREDKDLGQDQRLAKFRELREATGKKISAVLDPGQQKKWATLRESVLPGPPAGTAGRGGDGAPGVDRAELFRRVAAELKLTDEQQQKLQPVLREEGEKMRDLQADTSLSREEKLAKFQALRATAAGKFKAILTPEQQAHWETLRPGLQGGPGGAGGPGGLAAGQDAMQRLADELKLTKEQREKLRPILFAEFTQRQALRKNESLSREESLAKFKELHAATTAKVKPILAPEQLEKWVKLREDMLARRRDADGK